MKDAGGHALAIPEDVLDEAEAFHRALCVGDSASFRDPLTFALLEGLVLPEITP